jgi:Carboxypeptidase regulatory-like domain
VTIRTDAVGSKELPAPGARVTIAHEPVEGARPPLTKTADANGQYSFTGLRPATYSVSATQPGFAMSLQKSDEPVTGVARGCGVVGVVLRKNLAGNDSRTRYPIGWYASGIGNSSQPNPDRGAGQGSKIGVPHQVRRERTHEYARRIFVSRCCTRAI